MSIHMTQAHINRIATAVPRRLGRLERAALRGVMVREVVNFSSFWRSSTFSSTVDPTIYLLAFGFGFGSLVSEVAGYAISSDLLEFIDIEDVPGAFVEPLDRVRLDALPADGAWLRPTRSLREFVSSYAARRPCSARIGLTAAPLGRPIPKRLFVRRRSSQTGGADAEPARRCDRPDRDGPRRAGSAGPVAARRRKRWPSRLGSCWPAPSQDRPTVALPVISVSAG